MTSNDVMNDTRRSWLLRSSLPYRAIRNLFVRQEAGLQCTIYNRRQSRWRRVEDRFQIMRTDAVRRRWPSTATWPIDIYPIAVPSTHLWKDELEDSPRLCIILRPVELHTHTSSIWVYNRWYVLSRVGRKSYLQAAAAAKCVHFPLCSTADSGVQNVSVYALISGICVGPTVMSLVNHTRLSFVESPNWIASYTVFTSPSITIFALSKVYAVKREWLSVSWLSRVLILRLAIMLMAYNPSRAPATSETWSRCR